MEHTPRRFCFTIVGHPLSPNGHQAASVAARIRDRRHFRELAAWTTRHLYTGPPLERARVTFTLQRPDRQYYDPTNAYGVVKPIEDGLCRVHGGALLVDDSAAHVEVVVRQKHGPQRAVLVEIEELDPHASPITSQQTTKETSNDPDTRPH